MQVIVFEYRVTTLGYFLDEMQQYEVNSIISNIKYLDRTQKETDRFKLYVDIQSNSKKKIKVEDVMNLPWDKEQFETVEVSDLDFEKAAKEQDDIKKRMEARGFKFN